MLKGGGRVGGGEEKHGNKCPHISEWDTQEFIFRQIISRSPHPTPVRSGSGPAHLLCGLWYTHLLSRASTFTFLQFHTVWFLKKCMNTLITESPWPTAPRRRHSSLHSAHSFSTLALISGLKMQPKWRRSTDSSFKNAKPPPPPRMNLCPPLIKFKVLQQPGKKNKKA